MTYLAKKLAICSVVSLSGFSVGCQNVPDSPGGEDANLILVRAKEAAQKTHRVVFLSFGASWCSSCRYLTAFLNNKEIKNCFAKHFEVVELKAFESAKSKASENVGAAELCQTLSHGHTGLPFYCMINSKGETVGSSYDPDRSDGPTLLGFPVDYSLMGSFLRLLKKTSPDLSTAELWKIRRVMESPKDTW